MAKTLLALALALAAALPVISLSGCSPEVPANPTYERDVKPIFMARCVRCHDETLRSEVPPPGYPVKAPPMICHLNRYDNEPVGCTMGTPPCSLGASECANFPGLGSYIAGKIGPLVEDDPGRMPPPPAPALNDWEWEVVNKWLTNLDANGAPLRE